MTGYTVHTGSSKKFSTNWDQIFVGKKTTPDKTKSAGSSPKKKAPSKKK